MPTQGPRDRRLISSSLDRALEAFEPRTMFSVALPDNATWVDWNGGQVAAIQSSYVMTMDQSLPSRTAEMMARAAATKMGARLESFQLIGQGFSALMNLDRDVDQSRLAQVVRTMSNRRGPRIQAIEPLEAMAARKAQAIRVFLNATEPIERLASRLDRGEGSVSIILMLTGREVEVKLPGQYRVTPQVAGAIKAVPGVVHVEMG